jgi:hypothetical protein
MSVHASTCFLENRRCSRYHLRLPVLFSWTDKSRQQGAGFTRDIGVDGVFIFAEECPPTGTTIDVELVLPLPKDSSRELRLRCIGKVIRVDANYPQGHGFAVTADFGRRYHSEFGRA